MYSGDAIWGYYIAKQYTIAGSVLYLLGSPGPAVWSGIGDVDGFAFGDSVLKFRTGDFEWGDHTVALGWQFEVNADTGVIWPSGQIFLDGAPTWGPTEELLPTEACDVMAENAFPPRLDFPWMTDGSFATVGITAVPW